MAIDVTNPQKTAPAGKPRRADAIRNRARVLDAAREIFAEQGRETQMDDVAARAGVGVGTVYRHFPDKAALMRALLAERLGQISALAAEALAHPDPWEGFAQWLFASGELQAGDRGFCDCLADAVGAEDRELVAREVGLVELTEAVIKRGQEAGVIRPDARPSDVPLIMSGVATTSRCAGNGTDTWRRHLTIALEGLRAPGETPLPD